MLRGSSSIRYWMGSCTTPNTIGIPCIAYPSMPTSSIAYRYLSSLPKPVINVSGRRPQQQSSTSSFAKPSPLPTGSSASPFKFRNPNATPTPTTPTTPTTSDATSTTPRDPASGTIKMTVTPRSTTASSPTPATATATPSVATTTTAATEGSSSAAASTPIRAAAVSVAASPYARMFQNPNASVGGTGNPLSSAAASSLLQQQQQRSGMSKGFGMGHQPQSLADALAFTNKLRQGFNATKHESNIDRQRQAPDMFSTYSSMFPSTVAPSLTSGPNAAAASLSPSRATDFPKTRGGGSSENFLAQLLQGHPMKTTEQTPFGQVVQLQHGAFDWLMSSTKPRLAAVPADTNDDSKGAGDDTSTTDTTPFVDDSALQHTLATSASNMIGEPILVPQYVSQAEQDAMRQHIKEKHDAELAAQRLDHVMPVVTMTEKQRMQMLMREALAQIEHERSKRSAEELIQAEADENKATIMSSRAANAAAEELARQQRNQEEATAMAFLRQQLRETEEAAGIHDPQMNEKIEKDFMMQEQKQRQPKKKKDEKKEVVISPRGNTIKYLARTMHVKTEKIIREARQFLDENVTRDTSLSEELAEEIIKKFGHIVVRKQQSAEIVIAKEEYSKLPPRAPVVCVMGHVDHGKTTLLDTLRHTNVVAKEAGAITQGIGAFKVEVHSDDQTFTTTFLDTPGHAAFKSMRAKGANTGLTDIIVLVVSAMDGIQPQTEEAIRLARASDIPLVVAINKMDLDGADADYVRGELKRRNVNVDGDVLAIPISAKFGNGLDELQEAIQMTADELDLRAPSTGIVQAFIVESRLDRNNGHVVNVVVRRGTLRVGDYVVSGMQYNKVRFLVDDRGERVTEAGPSIAVSIPSWKSLDGLGDELITVDTEAKAKELVAAKQQEIEMANDIADDEVVAARKAANRGREKREVNRKELVMKRRNKDKKAVELRKELIANDKAAAEAEAKEMKTTLPVIVRGDVSGSIQVFLDYIKQLPNDEVKIMVIRSGLGEVTDVDVKMAIEFKAAIFAFNVKTKAAVTAAAKSQGIAMYEQNVIYHLFDDLRGELGRLLPSNVEQVQSGMAEVKQVFALDKGSQKESFVAGCIITHGKLSYKGTYELYRYKQKLWSGKLTSLRHHKSEVQELEKGTECGIVLSRNGDDQPPPEPEVGDTLRCFITRQRDRLIDDTEARQFANWEEVSEAATQSIEHRVAHAPLIREV